MLKSRWILVVTAGLALAAVSRCIAQDAQPGASKVEIRRATYEPIEGTGGADVTEKVKALVKDGRLSMTASNKALGGDPAPGRHKQLRVEYLLDGKPQVVVVKENVPLEIPPVSPWERREKLIAVLRSGASLYEKCNACRQLAVVGTKEDVPLLAGLLADEKLSHMARYALEPIPDPSVDDALREALGKLKGTLLVGVINSIGVRHDEKAIEALAGLLSDPDAEVASAAAMALGKIGTTPAAKALEQALQDAPAALRPALCDGLLRCADALAAKGQREGAVAIYDRLCSLPAPPPTDMAALRGAILARQAGGAPLLIEQLHSADPRHFAVALRVALELPGTEVTQAVTTELNKLPADRQPLLIQALSKRGDPAALPALLAAARGGETDIRVAAIRALPEIGDPSAIPTLVEALGDPDGGISSAARDGLAGLPGKEADDAVVAMLGNPQTARRLDAIELVARRRMMTVIPLLLKTADDADQEVRLAAYKTLGQLGGAAEAPALLDRLMNAKEAKEIDAIEKSLRTISARMDNPDSCTERVIERLPQGGPEQKIALLRILSAAGGAKALQAVRTAVDDANPEIHATAIRTLGKWRTPDAARELLELATASRDETDKLLCLRSAIGLADNRELSLDQRLTVCQQAAPLIQRDEEKKLLLGALGGIASPDAFAMVTPYLDDPATKEEASAAVLSIADKLLRDRKTSKKNAPKVVAPLQRVLKTTANANLAKRAELLLNQAQNPPSRR